VTETKATGQDSRRAESIEALVSRAGGGQRRELAARDSTALTSTSGLTASSAG